MSIHAMSIERGSEAGIDLMPAAGAPVRRERSQSDHCSLRANRRFVGYERPCTPPTAATSSMYVTAALATVPRRQGASQEQPDSALADLSQRIQTLLADRQQHA